MTLTETPPATVTGGSGAVSAGHAARRPAGLAAWLGTADPSKVGRLYVVTSLVMALGALVLWAILAAERIDASGLQVFERPSDAQQTYTLAAFSLMFFVALPLLLGVAIGAVPGQIGARTIAFPRAAAASYWVWLVGSGIVVAAYLANGGPFGGEPDGVQLFLVGLLAVLIGLTLAAVCVATSVLTLRAPGMRVDRVPSTSFGAMVGSSLLVLTLPVAMANLVLLYADHRNVRQTFNGNQGIWPYLDWLVRQPQVYVVVAFALGVIADVVPTMAGARQRLTGFVQVAIGLAGAVAFGAWAQQNYYRAAREELLFVGMSVLAVVPPLVLAGVVALSLKEGKVRLAAPLVWAVATLLMTIVTVAVGVLTGIDGLDLVGTTYEESVLLYATLGSALLAGGTAVVYWAPRWWGRTVPDRPMTLLGVLGLLGVVLVAFPDVVLGFLDQAMMEMNYDAEGAMEALNGVHLAGAAVLALTVLAVLGLVLKAATSGPRADADPWNGQTLEWAGDRSVGVVTSAQPLLDAKEATA